jgi:hypothetical protein
LLTYSSIDSFFNARIFVDHSRLAACRSGNCYHLTFKNTQERVNAQRHVD